MRYIDRRFLFPAVAATAWAQQPSQPDPAAAEAEAALRARIEQFYQLQVDKKFRQSEALVAEDSKDDFYNGAKPDIKDFSIQEIQLLDNNSRAKVTLKGKFLIRAPFGAQVFDMPAISFWKIENGQWVWYLDREFSSRSPFGSIKPPGNAARGTADPIKPVIDVATLLNQVTVDGTAVTLNGANPVQTVTVSNNLPGPIHLELTKPLPEGVSIEVEKSDPKAGEKSAIRFRLTGETKISGVVRLVASPLNKVFEIQVHAN